MANADFVFASLSWRRKKNLWSFSAITYRRRWRRPLTCTLSWRGRLTTWRARTVYSGTAWRRSPTRASSRSPISRWRWSGREATFSERGTAYMDRWRVSQTETSWSNTTKFTQYSTSHPQEQTGGHQSQDGDGPGERRPSAREGPATGTGGG